MFTPNMYVYGYDAGKDMTRLQELAQQDALSATLLRAGCAGALDNPHILDPWRYHPLWAPLERARKGDVFPDGWPVPKAERWGLLFNRPGGGFLASRLSKKELKPLSIVRNYATHERTTLRQGFEYATNIPLDRRTHARDALRYALLAPLQFLCEEQAWDKPHSALPEPNKFRYTTFRTHGESWRYANLLFRCEDCGRLLCPAHVFLLDRYPANVAVQESLLNLACALHLTWITRLQAIDALAEFLLAWRVNPNLYADAPYINARGATPLVKRRVAVCRLCALRPEEPPLHAAAQELLGHLLGAPTL